ncbi:MAG: ferredoxin [Steroidobacteraceae bacterium]|nr:ferredoxin [Steroidobacteraceae bacterium]MDW8258388.1 ferredoxin [Gammaproteobacteria bacterium]
MKIIVKRALCSGHARCANVAPELFRLNDDGYIDMDDFEVPRESEALARRAVRACPERALRIAAESDTERSGDNTAESVP